MDITDLQFKDQVRKSRDKLRLDIPQYITYPEITTEDDQKTDNIDTMNEKTAEGQSTPVIVEAIYVNTTSDRDTMRNNVNDQNQSVLVSDYENPSGDPNNTDHNIAVPSNNNNVLSAYLYEDNVVEQNDETKKEDYVKFKWSSIVKFTILVIFLVIIGTVLGLLLRPTSDSDTTSVPSLSTTDTNTTLSPADTNTTLSPADSNKTYRLFAYMDNSQVCPDISQFSLYSHISIAFAVSYTWAPSQNECNTACKILTPPVCENMPNVQLIQKLKSMGKKVLITFGGTGMGGSWDLDVNNCWDYCFGRESNVVDNLVTIASDLNADGIDITYNYFLADSPSRNFTKGADAVNFLKQVTIGLRNKLPSGSIITHTSTDSNFLLGTPYFDLLQNISSYVSFIIPQYYNGITAPVTDGIASSGYGKISVLDHYKDLVETIFQGDANKVVVGFCISDCVGFNTDAFQAATIMTDLKNYYSDIGGASFWSASRDVNGSWSNNVYNAIHKTSA